MPLSGPAPAPAPMPTTIHVDGLVLWRPGPEDAGLVVAAVNESLEHLRPWMEWAQAPAVAADTALRLALAAAAMDVGGDGSWVMGDAARSGVIGGCGLHDRVGPGARDIGYWVHVDGVGRGVASRAAAALCWVGFHVLGLEWVEVHCDVANAASAAVPARLGFTLARDEPRPPAAPANTGRMAIWALRREDWAASPAARYRVEAVAGGA